MAHNPSGGPAGSPPGLLRRQAFLMKTKTLKGAETVEFVATFPVLFGMILLIILLAIGWHQRTFISVLTLQSIPYEAMNVTDGQIFARKLLDSYGGSKQDISFAITDYVDPRGGGPGLSFRIYGSFTLPFLPFLENRSVNFSSGLNSPRWEFMP
jgi:hypothetical protein